ncbi:MAG TPA: phenylalanine 4-monooxygenase [Legionellales bacterium]|jgi:phenylalanine-4-hydroxylase|nr:phenylalanine 4-monooxygenase [Legionellales bacterium]
MGFVSRYESNEWDDKGYVNYSSQEHDTWKFLYERQIQIVEGRAVPEYIEGLKKLELNHLGIPQLPDVNERLKKFSNWQVQPVKCAISSEEFFMLLSQAHFPVATFIRLEEDIDYITEPDIFHELFGHIPLYTVKHYADFVQEYAKIALTYPASDWNAFLRLFWFTVEFGLIQTPQGMRIYGGGILSSYSETLSCLERDESLRAYFDPVSVLRTPYRIDILQNIYYVIQDFKDLFDLVHLDFKKILERAKSLGKFPALYPLKESENVQNSHKLY